MSDRQSGKKKGGRYPELDISGVPSTPKHLQRLWLGQFRTKCQELLASDGKVTFQILPNSWIISFLHLLKKSICFHPLQRVKPGKGDGNSEEGKEGGKEGKRKRNLPSTCWFTLQSAKTSIFLVRNATQVSYLSSRGPGIWAIFCCLLECVSRKWNQQQRWDINWQFDMGSSHPKMQFNLLCPNETVCILWFFEDSYF